MTARLAALLLPLSAALGQTRLTAHPQDTLQNTNGNLAPFGCLSPTSFTEARCQVLIRAFELPGPGAVLTGIEVHSQGGGALTYAWLDIAVSPTPATGLSAALDANLRAPVPVLQTNGHTIAFAQGAFTRIPCQPLYVHDGSSALVLDIRKVVDPASQPGFTTMSTTSDPPRSDLPPMAYAVGGPGSGAALAPRALAFAAPIVVRLCWVGAPTLRLRADPSPTPPGYQYALGTTLMRTAAGPPGALALCALGTAWRAPFAVAPEWVGEWRIVGDAVDVAVLPASGELARSIPIPAGFLGLIGVRVVHQAAVFDPAVGVVQCTNAIDHEIHG